MKCSLETFQIKKVSAEIDLSKPNLENFPNLSNLLLWRTVAEVSILYSFPGPSVRNFKLAPGPKGLRRSLRITLAPEVTIVSPWR
jgi:hypothetical protein